MLNARKNYLRALLAAGIGVAALSVVTGQTYVSPYAPSPPVAAAADSSQIRYTADQLDQMLGPIALYPDPLLSVVLAASTYPQDVAALGLYLQNDPTPTADEITTQTWDASVKALVTYPDVVRMMNSQIAWTESVGIAFANQPQDVMDTVQRLRGKAQAAQNLVTTPQQQVVQNAGMIEILPAQPQVIYVPVYDPVVVYTTPRVYFGFGNACYINGFFDLGFDWRARAFHRGVHWDRDWRRPSFVGAPRWEHDRRRPIPVPVRPVVPPRGIGANRGWDRPNDSLRGLNPNAAVRARAEQQRQADVRPNPGPGANRPAPAPNTPAPGVNRPAAPAVKPAAPPQRPVTGLPNVPPRAQPTPPAVKVPESRQPVPPQARPAAPARPVTPPAPVAPRAVAPPAKPAAPAVQPRPAAPVQRPVTGLPARNAPPPKATPAPPRNTPPTVRANPAPQRPPSQTVRPSNPGGSARGHQSMKK